MSCVHVSTQHDIDTGMEFVPEIRDQQVTPGREIRNTLNPLVSELGFLSAASILHNGHSRVTNDSIQQIFCKTPSLRLRTTTHVYLQTQLWG